MPPFQLPERIVTLVFEDGPLKGLELEVRLAIPLDAYFEIQEKLAAAVDKKTGLETVRDLLRYFAQVALVGWNLVDRDGLPIEPDADSFSGKIDPRSGMAMVVRYIKAVGGVSVPLAPASANGRTSKGRKASVSRSS